MADTVSESTITRILQRLENTYYGARPELHFANPFQLLIAVMLSAQSTDKRVNVVTARLFGKYKTPADFIQLGQAGLEAEIKELGLYHNKAKNIIATCQTLLEEFAGQVPRSITELQSLPGVGRKTANVVASNAFGVPAIAVDTHVFRVANRLGLADSDNVVKVEEQLMEAIPQDKWSDAHHWLIWHGRRVCMARKPKCDTCPVKEECRFKGVES
ncbi:MAG TPA: endonuclease III [Desulfobacteria bacterium]|nr:endonuclease III [Desulfobacteria bacterium]